MMAQAWEMGRCRRGGPVVETEPVWRAAFQARPAVWAGLLTLSWVVVAGLGVISGFHLAHREPRSVIVGLVAVTPWVYMLAWVTASVGLWARRRALAAISLVLVGLQLWWVAPDFDPVSHLDPPEPDEVAIRLFDANLSQSNADLDAMAKEILRDRPEVVTMEELTPVALRSSRASHVMNGFHYGLVRATPGSYGMALWSVHSLAGAAGWYAARQPSCGPGWSYR